MARGPTSFVEGLQKILGDLGHLEASPDADRGMIGQLREMILGHVQSAHSPQGGDQAAPPPPGGPPGPPPGGPGGMMVQAPPGGLPVDQVQGAQDRGPTPAPDMSGAISELQRTMSGGA